MEMLKGVREYLSNKFKSPIKKLEEDRLENTMQIDELEELIEKFNNNGGKVRCSDCVEEVQ